MASKILLVLGALVSLGATILPPCLPHLGPEYCPDTATAYGEEPPFPLAQVAYPDKLYQEKAVREELFPLLNKTKMLEYLRIYAGTEDENRS